VAFLLAAFLAEPAFLAVVFLVAFFFAITKLPGFIIRAKILATIGLNA
jgi:hypothetical protein